MSEAEYGFNELLLGKLDRVTEELARTATALETLAKNQRQMAASQRVEAAERRYFDQGDSSPESGHGEGIPALRRPKSAANG